MGKTRKKPHKKIKEFCITCAKFHTKGEHRFHGRGSFARTH